MATTASAAATLIPSQIRSSSSSLSSKKKSGGNSMDGLNINAKEFVPPKESNTTHHSEGIGEGNSKQPNKRPRNRKRNPNNNNNKQKNNNKNSNRKQKSSDESKTNNEELSADNSKTTTEITETLDTTEAAKKKNRKKLPRNRRGGLPNNNNNQNNNDDDDGEGKQKGNNTDKKKNRPKSKKKKGPKKNNNKKNAKAWRNYIPEGAVDPITLDPLDSLNYPPFALFIEPPYKPVYEWPPASCICGDTNNEKKDKNDSSSAAAAAVANEEEIKKYHLFDGRVLAYYLVSQLQFIDPLNRRDLTSEEIISLDKYLKKHKLGYAQVYEAYQKKGTTINSAGQIAQSAQGRARMLQQEASSILQSLFHNNNGGGDNNIDVLGSTNNHHHQQQQTHNRSATNESSFRNDFRREYSMNNYYDNNDNNPYGVMGDLDSGLVVIDDNINPGLRSGASRPSTGVVEESFPPLLSSETSTRNNASTYSQQQESTTQEESFPTLHASSTDNINNKSTSTTGAGKYNNVVARSLKIASKLITKTDPKEVAKQKKARQEAQRRAALSQLTLLNPTTTNTSYHNTSLSSSTNNNNNSNNNELEDQKHSSSATPHPYDIEARVERNRAVAEALNIKPSIMHMNAPNTGTPTFHSGWTCPVLQKEDMFKKELEMTLYPESLILLAKEQMTSLDELIKLDKKWTRFLRDDKASYINLKPMLKPKRIMVHTYSDYWNLQTQSFDKDPKRYICCKKSLGETRAPYPLLSDVVRLYRKGSMKNFGVLSTTANTNNKDNANGGTDMDTIRKRDPSLMSTQEGDGDERKQQQLPPREFPSAGDRTPLPLLPPQNIMMNPAPGTMYDTYSNNNASTTTTPESTGSINNNTLPPNNNNNNNSRFSSLAPSSQDRPRLNLQPRTIPTTLPPPPQEEKLLPSDHLADIYRKKKADLEQKLILEQKKKQAILESAFASDDEEEEEAGEERASKKGSFNDYGDVNDESSGAWDEEDEAYCSSSSDSE